MCNDKLLAQSSYCPFSKSKRKNTATFQLSTVKAAHNVPYLYFLSGGPLVAIVVVTAAKEEVRLHLYSNKVNMGRRSRMDD